jgi:hypothetical protein
MLTLEDNDTLIIRDLSHENLVSICGIAGTAVICILAALLGLVPLMLIGWTLHLPHLILAVPLTAITIILSVIGLLVTAIVTFCIIMGLIGCVSLCRKMAAPQTYHLANHTTLTLEAHEKAGTYVLTIISPNKPESIINLNLLAPADQRHLLQLLQKRGIDATNTVGQESAAALQEMSSVTSAMV